MVLTRRWIFLLALGAVPLLAAGAAPGVVWLTLVWDGLLVALALADFMLLPPLERIQVDRVLEPSIRLGTPAEVRLRVRNGTELPWRLKLLDEPPVDAFAGLAEWRLALPPYREQHLSYSVQARARGDAHFGDLWLQVLGRMGLVARNRRIPASTTVRVYPLITQAARFTLAARRGRLQQAGIRAAQRVGGGRQFESLRDYQPDDDFRWIDWKATARRATLTTRQYEAERSQNVILALDVGRTMLGDVDGVPKLDYAVDAALLLAYVATLADDRVGMLVFADAVEAWVPPQRGRGQVYSLLNLLYNVHARRVEPDYRSAFGYMAARWRRRSLVVCFTDLWDPDSARLSIGQLSVLQPRHLVACVTLMDTNVLRAAQAELYSPTDVYRQAAAMQVLEDRARAGAELQQRGVLVVDTPAERLSAELVNRYLEVKERAML
ncbi:MAG: DUF58 domain-containing protein [Chthonomonadales bacterium]